MTASSGLVSARLAWTIAAVSSLRWGFADVAAPFAVDRIFNLLYLVRLLLFSWDWKLLASSSLIDVAGSALSLRQDLTLDRYLWEQSVTWLLPLSYRFPRHRFLVSMFKVLSWWYVMRR